jgi:TolB protein
MKFKRLFRVAVLSVAAALSLAASAHASFPGQNGKIAFTGCTRAVGGECDVYSMNPDGSGVTNLTNTASPYNESEPAWSPEGRYIAFVRYDGTDQNTLHRMQADGSGVSAPLDRWYGVFDPAWSPDAQKIAFVHNPEVATESADGSGYRSLTEPSRDGADLSPAWSPDGSKVAYVHSDYPVSNYDIHVIHPDGSEDGTLTTGPADEVTPNWSPDGQKIVFRVENSEFFGGSRDDDGIYIMKADGTEIAQLPGTQSDRDPAWSPDGSKIVVSSWNMAAQAAEIDTIDPDGTNRTTIYSTGSASGPDWQAIPPSTGFPRPKGATPLNVSLALAYDRCFAPNRTHAPPLAADSCSPPQQSSANLTVGTLDSNGEKANFAGYVRFDVMKGNLATPEDEADVRLQVSLKDVRCRIAINPCSGGALSDYTGELRGRVVPRVTDQYNGVLRDQRATVADWEGTEYPDPAGVILPYTVPCTATLDSAIGSSCTLDTTLDSLVPGVIPEGKRSLWQLDSVDISDAGADGVVNPERDATTPFAVQGIFAP